MGRGRRYVVRVMAVLGCLLGLGAGYALAHAFPERSDPRVGAVLRAAPTLVRIWFDGELEPAFSTITVTDGTARRVDLGDAHVDGDNRRLLRVGLQALSPGVYRVIWRVLAVDGHLTQGDYRFTLKPPE